MDIFYEIISVLLMAFVFVHLWASILIGWVAKQSEWKYPALNERFVTSIIQSISAVGLGALGANRVFDLGWSPETVLLIISIALLVKVGPSFVWLFLYYTDGFHADGSLRDRDWSGEERER